MSHNWNRYNDWYPTPQNGISVLEDQVIADLKEVLSPSAETMDRLTGKDELDQKLRDILFAYRNHEIESTKKQVTNTLSNSMVQIFQPILANWMESQLKGYTPVRPPISAPLSSSPPPFHAVNQI